MHHNERGASSSSQTTSPFGYADVDPAEKTRRVRGVFDSVAGRYDLMNDLMSGGIHRLWKNAFVAQIAPQPGQACVDVAGGTGDIAFRLARAGTDVVVCDINQSMLSVGRDRAIDRGFAAGDVDGGESRDGRLAWACAAAEALPLADRSVDLYTIAFGLRNVTDIPAALAEARRVLRPGGRFFCLEFSRVWLPPLKAAYDAYSFAVLPRLGQLVAGDGAAYRYLAESIRRFPEQRALVGLMEQAGLGRARFRNLSGGIAAIHSAWRL